MDEAKMRVEAVGQINALLANRNAAVERLNRAKAELGTARSEVDRIDAEYHASVARLTKLCPPLTAPPASRSE